MNVLVTGTTGAVGPRVVQALSAAGHRVRTLSLDAPSAGQCPDDVETQIGNVTDPSAVQSAEGTQGHPLKAPSRRPGYVPSVTLSPANHI